MAEEYVNVGKRVPLVDGYERASGKARFVNDINLPGMLHAKILRSPHPHARIASIDTSKAEALPGVKATWTYKDINPPIAPFRDDKVRHVGDIVAAVAAIDEEIAEEALDLIEVEYEVLPALLTVEDALAPGAPEIWPGGNVQVAIPAIPIGDVEQGFTEADITIEQDYANQKQQPYPLGPGAVIVDWNVGTDFVTLYENTQGIVSNQGAIAGTFALPISNVRAVCKFATGGYGSGSSIHEQPIIAMLSQKTGRPVRYVRTREEQSDMECRRGVAYSHCKIGAKSDGMITAIDVTTTFDGGALGAAGPFSVSGGPTLDWYNKCPNRRWGGKCVYTNTMGATGWRNYGYSQGALPLEQTVERLAAELNMDPLELRLKNIDGNVEALTYGAEAFGWEDNWKPFTQSGTGVKKRGVGMGLLIGWTAGAGSLWDNPGAVIVVNNDGTITLNSATTDFGVASNTTLSQIAAEEFGVRTEDVRGSFSDTASAPYAISHYASRGCVISGRTVQLAARDAKSKLLEIAAPMLGVSPEDLEARDRVVYVKADPAEEVSIKDVIAEGLKQKKIIVGYDTWLPLGPPEEPFNTYSAQFYEVEVDTETGKVDIVKAVLADDSGFAVNPGVVEQQVGGGFQSHGIGLAFEDRCEDPATGRTLNPDLDNYKMATCLDVAKPEYCISSIQRPAVLNPYAPYGARGVGEPASTLGYCCTANAVYNAVGVWVSEAPITEEKILKGLGKI